MEYKCSKCGIIKNSSEFYKNNTNKRGLNYWCKDCNKTKKREQYSMSPEKYKTASSKYRDSHPGSNKQYREANKEKEKIRSIRYYNNNKEKEKKRHADWRDRNPEWSANHHARHPEKRKENKLRKYNLTLAEYYELLEKQNGKCVICETSGDSKNTFPCVDHCHDSGMVRGLLCKYCNASLGLMRDDPQLLENAAEYLYKFKKLMVVKNVI